MNDELSQEVDEAMPVLFNNSEEELMENQNDINDLTTYDDCRHDNKKKNMTIEQKNAVVQLLLRESEFGKKKWFPRGSVKKISEELLISSRSIWRLWEAVKSFKEDGIYLDFSSKLCKCVGRKIVEFDMELIKGVVARPRVDKNSGMFFDGKIGIWPFVFKESAKCSSKNRIAGTMETKPIASIRKEVIRSCLIEKVLPAIKEKWPLFCSKNIFIQNDNAKPHLDVTDIEFNDAANTDGFEIQLCCQPPNSPDMNVLDLGFFGAIDSLQFEEAPTNIDEFISAVEKAYEVFPSKKLNNVFLTLESCMVEVMKINGGNHYKIPHMKKNMLIQIGQLLNNVKCDKEVVRATSEFVSVAN